MAAAYAGAGWRVPDLLDAAMAAEDLWLDSVSQVRIGRWHDGRVALLGDAASSVSLFGDGSTLAMAGAHTLARELADRPDGAFARYEAAHRTLVGPRQDSVATAASLMVPSSRAGITTRNLASRLWPAAAAASWVRSRLTPAAA